MARDAIAFIPVLGHDQVDLFGFSLGGFVAQVIAEVEPRLVRKMILAGMGPAGGKGIDKVTAITLLDSLKPPSPSRIPRSTSSSPGRPTARRRPGSSRTG